MKVHKTRNELKVSDSKTYPLKNEERMKNDEERRRTMKNFHRIAYESVTETLRLDFSSRKCVFCPKYPKCIAKGVLNILKQLPPPLFIEKKRRCLPPKDLMKKISKRTRITKFTPLFVFYGKVTEALRNCFRI